MTNDEYVKEAREEMEGNPAERAWENG